MSGLRIGGLFFGYGGLDMAVQSVLGGELAWVSEIDRGACQIIAHRYPGVPNIGDITAVDWSTVEPVDILTGGSPCQDLSTAGRRAGMNAGTRSNLWVAMREAIAALRPRLVVWENVRGALSADAASDLEPCPGCVGDDRDKPVLRALGRVLGDLASLGYDARWHGVRASDMGAPHERFRIILIAHPRGVEPPAPLIRLIGSPRLGTGRGLLPTPVTGGESRAHKGGNPTLWGAIDGIDETTATRLGIASTPGLLPTPAVFNLDADTPERFEERRAETGSRRGPNLNIAARMLPTPDVSSAPRSAESHARGDHQVSLNDIGHLLPTPMCQDEGPAQDPADRKLRGHGAYLNDIPHLLPTPAVNDMGEGKTPDEFDAWNDGPTMAHQPHSSPLSIEVKRLLTPKATNNENRPSESFQGGVGYEIAQQGLTRRDWGRYAAAIARWEALTRPVPEPMTWNAEAERADLNPELPEWMMGLPAGWVTDPAIWDGYLDGRRKPASAQYIRRAQLHALGNGVCPPQAAAALIALLDLRVEPWADGLVIA